MHHPLACETLNRQAQLAGARVVRGVDQIRIQMGAEPRVTYRVDGADVQLSCRLIVGADGRTSTVRQQAGIDLHRAEPDNMTAGLLVEGATDWPQDSYALGTEGDRMYLVFPQGGDRLRLYLCVAPGERDRFAGPDGTARFLASFGLRCMPYSATVVNAKPIGPCATWGGEDTWTDPPFADGVILIGDAAGYNNPIIGQGLSLALRDVEVVSELLLGNSPWTPATFQPYADERRERMRRVRFNAALFADLFCSFGPAGAQRRGSWLGRMASGEDPTMQWVVAGILVGPDQLPPSAYDDAYRERVLAGGAPA
jgi:2-polyprenyl-6-methoxyphenol hydroxylase-like FAD-dependent oxidoreductase